jgi:hypothetical protein
LHVHGRGTRANSSGRNFTVLPTQILESHCVCGS